MRQILELKFGLRDDISAAAIQKAAARLSGVQEKAISDCQILKKSLDARGKNIHWVYRIELFTDGEKSIPISPFQAKNVSNADPVIIVGAGPAGLFAALSLIEAGRKPIIFERGKNVSDRRRDLANITRNHTVNEDSNYCFGEGGAGTYSDGKLYTRSNKRGNLQRVLELLVLHGADESILYDTHPHIGTNKLPGIISRIRHSIEDCGGEVHFQVKVTDIQIKNNHVDGVTLSNGHVFNAKQLVLATGHSARDIFHILAKRGVLIESKPFALGVRVEHPQELIDSIQYHCPGTRNSALPAASYSLVEQIQGAGVFSFCMCPGGIIAPAMTSPGEIVVNGWSPSKRNNPFANSGIVTSISPEMYAQVRAEEHFKALEYQADVEKRAYQSVQTGLKAPAQRLHDFIQNRSSGDLPHSSYLPGLVPVHLKEVLPQPVLSRLQNGLMAFGKKLKGFDTNEAIVVATESRTSSPVRIPRNKETFEHPQIRGLYPCSEGAGYAGGIVSAAMDGMNCAHAISLTK